jgi:hypothetical protein
VTRRIQAGARARVVAQTSEVVELESPVRLRPGQSVEVVLDRCAPPDVHGRAACVVTWAVSRLGKDGPMYRGICRWQ